MQEEQQQRRGKLPGQQGPQVWPVLPAGALRLRCSPEATLSTTASPARQQIDLWCALRVMTIGPQMGLMGV